MTLPDGYSDVPAGKLAAVVTHLEMTARAPSRPGSEVEGLTVRAVPSPDVAWYRDLYTRIGADNWLWFSRLKLTAEALEAKIRHPQVEIFALAAQGRDEGLLELSFETEGECELLFFGVTERLIGKGAGRLLMNTAIDRAWSRPIRRFSVHTCTLDHPGAPAFYIRSGFRPYRRQVEIADDPRLTGVLRETAAPHVPIIR
jgi:GNAT superfamily N-acetyltransferase